MIDVESDVFSAVASVLRNTYPGISVDSSFISDPGKFPYVSIVEADNRIRKRMRTTVIENAIEVMYEVNVLSAKSSQKKTEAKKIADTIDTVFAGLGFTRTMREQIPNYLDASVFRLVMRYEAIIGAGNTAGTYLIYQSY